MLSHFSILEEPLQPPSMSKTRGRGEPIKH
jgi:hypothetical protein